MALVNKIFRAIAAIEALFFLIAFLMTLQDPRGSDSGGREMSLIFGIILPSLVLGLVSVSYTHLTLPTIYSV